MGRLSTTEGTYLPTFSSFKGLVVPHALRRGTAEADAPINVHRSPPKCSDAPKVDSRCGQRLHTRV